MALLNAVKTVQQDNFNPYAKKSQALPIFIGINLTFLVFVYGLLLYNCILVEDSGHVQ